MDILENIKLYNNVVVVHGYKRSLLMDLQTSRYIFVENEKYNGLFNNNQNPKLILAMQEKHLLFPSDIGLYANCFTKINLSNYNSHYYNLIIDINNNSFYNNIIKITNFICNINCNSLQIRFCKSVSKNKILHFLFLLCENNMLENLEIIINSSCLSEKLLRVCEKIPTNICHIDTYGEKKTSYDHFLIKKHLNFNPFYTNRFFLKFYFNKQFYIEAQNSNPYFFNKLYIDFNGIIYNAPELKHLPIANLFTDNFLLIKSYISEYNSKIKYNISKNNIDICSDCELKYSCYDNRIPIAEKKSCYYNEYCAYNPYIAKWEMDKGYISSMEWLKNRKK